MRFMRNWLRRARIKSRPLHRARLRVEQLETRLVPYSVSGNSWPHPNLVTISFVPDGTNLGGATSNMFATFNAKWATTTWENQILNAAQVWAQQTNLNFAVVSDNGSQIGSGNYEQGDPNMGDIRIGGYNFGTSTLASAYLPPPVNNYSIAGDWQFDTGQVFNIGSTYDLFTVAAHEMGHALGLLHSTVANAIMYSSYNTRKTALNSDDISGIQAIYGAAPVDSVSNSTFATATNLQNNINTTSLTALVTGLGLATNSDVDYYTFTAPTGTNSSFTVTVQSQGLSLLGPSLKVYASDQVTVLGSTSGTNRQGNTLTLTITGATAGTQYYVKVAGADSTAFATGAYNLVLNFGSGAAPTVTLPNTQTLAGSPPTTGGGQPDSPPPPDQDSPGRDVFTLNDDQAAQHGAASFSQQTRQIPPMFAFTLAAGSAVPLLSTIVAAAPARTISHESGTSQTFTEVDSLHTRAAVLDGGGTSDDDDAGASPAFSETGELGIDAPVSVQAIDAFFAAAGQAA